MFELLTAIFPSWFEFGAVFAVFVLAELIYVAFGFGAGLIAVGLLALIMPVIQDVVVILLLVNIPVEMVVVWSSRKNLHWRGLLVILVGVGAGILLGTWILLIGTPFIILTFLGFFLVIAGSAFALIPHRGNIEWPKWVTPLVGLVSGILAGLFGTGGPPLIFYYQLQGTPKSIFRSSLMAIFLSMALVRVPVYTLTGLITLPRLLAAISIAPAVILGVVMGHKIHIQLNELTFRRLVGIILAIIGILLIGRHLAM
ncbi:sulfite exporter TauE/SafE family protein [candidate division CSSED10-310 bacterium]|uniref:Probable membrane transporter protein n=1 Tax=candidate division CSSED10-310 bacterium TaxID=2855610 RepID=A0ABV6Z1E8_UNCC1